MNKLLYLIFFILLLNNCNNQIKYEGKIISQESIESINYKNKENLLKKLGAPSFEDPISNKFFYYSKKEEKKSIINTKTNYDLLFVFEFDNKDNIMNSKVYDLNDEKINRIDLVSDETENEIVKRGLLERIFGGVGPQNEIQTSP